MKAVEQIKAKAKAAGLPISLDFETTGLNPRYYDQHIISCHLSNGRVAWGFLVNHPCYPETNGMPMVEALMDDPEMTRGVRSVRQGRCSQAVCRVTWQ